MKKLEKRVVEEVENLKNKFDQNKIALEFEKTKREFDELVDRGITKKRGNNLLSPTDAHIKSRVWFNVK